MSRAARGGPAAERAGRYGAGAIAGSRLRYVRRRANINAGAQSVHRGTEGRTVKQGRPPVNGEIARTTLRRNDVMVLLPAAKGQAANPIPARFPGARASARVRPPDLAGGGAVA